MRDDATETTADVVFGDFVLRQKIGEGGFGTVYLAEQQALARAAVVKVMRPSLAFRQDAIERFQLEARLASKLDHPSAAHIYACGAEADGTLWIAMELVKGTSLDRMLASGPLAVERAIPMLERLCEAVQTAHDQGIVHRDIKPANVMITARQGRLVPKLLDFGIAKQLIAATPAPPSRLASEPSAAPTQRTSTAPVALEQTLLPSSASAGVEQTLPSSASAGVDQTLPSSASSSASAAHDHTIEQGPTSTAQNSTARNTARGSQLTIAGQILGSPPYMAPEQWIDPNLVGPWTDQYALALLAYEALTGERARNGKTLELLAEQHRNDPLPRASNLSSAVHAVLARAASKVPEDRYRDLSEFIAALRIASGLVEDSLEVVPALRPELAASWIADAPAPIADAIAAIGLARSSHRVSERVASAASAIARWLGVLALASRSKIKPVDARSPSAQPIRDLRRRAPRAEDWLELAIALAAEIDDAELWPMPEMASWCRDRAAALAARELLRADSQLVDAAQDERALATQRLALLERTLESLEWLLDYEVGREIAGGIELWVGSHTDERVVRKSSRAAGADEDRVVVLDADGAPVVLLSPFAAIASPLAGAREEMFVFAGVSRTGAARLVAMPRGFERDDSELWSYLSEHLLDIGGGDRAEVAEERAPYPGLAAFATSDQASFVGREGEVTELVNRLRIESFATVVGPSGAGKSSFLAAGLVPALPAGWRAVTIRPGRDPLAMLDAVGDLVDVAPYRDTRHEDTASRSARLVATAQRAGMLVLIVDQAEELFTQGSTEEQRVAFAEALVELAASKHARVVVGVRDDFLCRFDEVAPLHGLIARNVQILGVPSRETLERIVVEPARRRGYDFDDPALPAEMVADVDGSVGALPLLSFAAAELWSRRDRHFKRLTRAAYEQIGGVSGALVKHADGVLESMTVAERKLVRAVFRRLLTAEGARVVHDRGELVIGLGGGSGGAAATQILERLIAARLIVTRDDDAGERVEIIHEALTRTWPRLAAWRDEDASSTKLHEQLLAAARHWDSRGRPDGLLWRDAALEDLRRWRAGGDRGLTALEDAFARASDDHARRARRRKLATLAVAFTVLGGAVVVLSLLSRQISKQRADAVDRVAAGFEERGRLAIANGEHAQALLYLTEAARIGRTGKAHALLVERAAAAVEGFERLELRSPDSIEFAMWTERTVVTQHDGSARLWDRTARSERAKIDKAIAAAPAGEGIVTLTADGEVASRGLDGATRWRHERVHVASSNTSGVVVGTNGTIATYRGTLGRLWAADGKPLAELEHGTRIQTAMFDSDGRRVAFAAGGELAIWDVASAQRLATCKTPSKRLPGVLFAADRVVIGGADGIVRVCNATTGEIVQTLSGHLGVAHLGTTDREGGLLVTGSLDGTARLWSLATGEPLGVLAGHRGAVRAIALSPDDKSLASGGEDGTVRIWDVESATQLASLEGHLGRITSLTWVGPEHLETASHDGTVRRWNVARARKHAIAKRHESAVWSMALSSGNQLVTQTFDHHVIVWDAASLAARARDAVKSAAWLDGTRLVEARAGGAMAIAGARPIRTGDREIVHVATSRDGKTIATASDEGVVRVWNPDGTARGHARVGVVAEQLYFDPAGRWFVVLPSTRDLGGAPIVDAAIGTELRRIAAGKNITAASVGERELAIAAGTELLVFDAVSWTARTLAHPSWVSAVAFASDGRIVTACNDATVTVWDRSSRAAATLPASGLGSALSTTPDGAWLAVGTADGTVDVWNLYDYSKVFSMRGHRQPILAMQWAQDGATLYSTGADGRVARWHLGRSTRSLDELARLVKCRVPLQLAGEVVLPRKIDFDDPACR